MNTLTDRTTDLSPRPPKEAGSRLRVNDDASVDSLVMTRYLASADTGRWRSVALDLEPELGAECVAEVRQRVGFGV